MRKGDWTPAGMLAEAVSVVAGIVYIVLQVIYGFFYPAAWHQPVLNILMAGLIYAALTLLTVYPERLNHLRPEACKGDIRKYSLRMVRTVKLLFMCGLMVPCICDVAGYPMPSLYTVAGIGLMLFAAIYYEVRIIGLIRDENGDKDNE